MRVAKVYKPFFETTKRYAILYGGAGSGKSYAAAQKVLYRTLGEAGLNTLVVRKVAATLRHSVYALVKRQIEKEGLASLFASNDTLMELTCRLNGNKIIFKGLDDPEKLKSIDEIGQIWIEEATELSELQTPDGLKSDIDQLDLRLRGEAGYYKQLILTFNPVSVRHWIKKKFIDVQRDDVFVLKTTYRDNPFIDKEYRAVMERLREQNYEYYRVYALGEWGSLSGLVYPNYKIVKDVPKYYETTLLGIDFGYNHPFAVVQVFLDGKKLYIDEVFYASEVENSSVIETVKRSRPDLLAVRGFADAARPDLISEWRRNGFNVQKAVKSVFEGIQKVKSYELYVTERSVNVLDELQTYSWKQDKFGNTLDEPVKFHDDAMDAIRYALTPFIKRQGGVKSGKANY